MRILVKNECGSINVHWVNSKLSFTLTKNNQETAAFEVIEVPSVIALADIFSFGVGREVINVVGGQLAFVLADKKIIVFGVELETSNDMLDSLETFFDGILLNE